MTDPILQRIIGQKIMDVTTGHPSRDVIEAQAAALVTSLGGVCFLGGMSCADAISILDDLCAEMRKNLVGNWGQVERGDH